MTEATHDSEAIYGIRKAVGKGARLWAGKITVSNAETLDTGLDTIEGITVSGGIEASEPTTVLLIVEPNAVSATGVITWNARKTTDMSTTGASHALVAATDTACYVIVVGTARGM